MVEELEIKKTEQKIVTLDQAIVKGSDAYIPYEFEYPNSDLLVEVKLKPITNGDFLDTIQMSKTYGTSLDIELLKVSVFNPDKTPISEDTFENLPAGIVFKLSSKIAEISGIEVPENKDKESLVDELTGF